MQIVKDRRALHAIPELDRRLPETMEYLEKQLSGLGCRVFSPAEGSLCAFFDFGKAQTIAFRADADALPITEATGLPFASCHPGRMHACGHDGHMAILLELARRLAQERTLPGNVLLVFQCAEETTGGAKDICESGIFDQYHTAAIFGLHIWPGLEAGTVASRSGPLMSRSGQLRVEITGRSAHIAKTGEGIDALAAATRFYTEAAALERSIPAHIPRLLKFGKLESGTVCNALAGSALLEGSLRAFEDDIFFRLRDGLLQIGKQLEQDTGCTVRIHLSEGYPAVNNPETLCRRVLELIPDCREATPSMTTEDFSYYQQILPGMFFFLGAGDAPPLHSADFNFDETILLKGAALFETLAEKFL